MKKIFYAFFIAFFLFFWENISAENIDKNNILFSPTWENKLTKQFIPEDLVEMEKYWIYTLRPRWNEWKIRKIVIDDLKDFQNFCFWETWKKIPVRSWYRSFYDQQLTFSKYSKDFSAQPWTSEHQLGLAVDFWFNNTFLNHKNFPELTKCFHENAYKYWFILSYWISNPYYNYEPWHFRYVWKNYAKIIKDNWLSHNPWVFLKDPEIYLTKIHQSKMNERIFLQEKIEISKKINKPYWEEISEIFSLNEDVSAKIFLKRKIDSSIKSWESENFRKYSCAYNYLANLKK